MGDNVTDRIIAAVLAVRTREGACTYRALADEVGLSLTATKYRVRQLVAAGRLLAGPIAGSIRLAPGEIGRFAIQWLVRAERDGRVSVTAVDVEAQGDMLDVVLDMDTMSRRDEQPATTVVRPSRFFATGWASTASD